jgi:hypothetical protein
MEEDVLAGIAGIILTPCIFRKGEAAKTGATEKTAENPRGLKPYLENERFQSMRLRIL